MPGASSAIDNFFNGGASNTAATNYISTNTAFNIGNVDIGDFVNFFQKHSAEHYIMLAVIIVVTLMLQRLIVWLLRHPLKKFAQDNHSDYVLAFIEAIDRPAGLGILLIGGFIIVKLGGFPEATAGFFFGVIKVAGGVTIAYTIFRLSRVMDMFLQNAAKRSDNKLDNAMVDMISKSSKIAIVSVSVIFIAQNLGFNMSGIIAGLGIGGLAVALAAQDTLANIFGSFIVLLDKPFVVGQRIKVMDNDGVILKIGLRSTRMETLDGTIVALPNKELVNATIENVTRRDAIKFTEQIGVEYSTDVHKLDRAIEIIREILSTTEHLDSEFHVNFMNFGDFSLNIRFFYWVQPPDYWLAQDVRGEINFRIKQQFDEEQISFAFPTQTIHAFTETKKARQPLPKRRRPAKRITRKPSRRLGAGF